MATPDITPQALGAFVVLLITNIIVLWGVDIGPKREAALEVILNGSVALGFLIHDAIVRHGRAQVAAAAAANGVDVSVAKK